MERVPLFGFQGLRREPEPPKNKQKRPPCVLVSGVWESKGFGGPRTPLKSQEGLGVDSSQGGASRAQKCLLRSLREKNCGKPRDGMTGYDRV